MTTGEVAALVGQDLMTVGFSCGGEGCMVARFKEPIDPQLWRQALEHEWPLGDGAVFRALLTLHHEGHELEGIFEEIKPVDPDQAIVLASPPTKEET